MNLLEIEEVLLESARSKAKISYCIWGKHGIGKTSLLEQLSKKLKYGIRNLRLSQIDATELIGFPTKKYYTFINEDGVSETIEYLDYAPPKWFIEALKGNYIIFLDEFNRSRKDNIQAAFELVNERSLNGKKLPDSVEIVVACNPSNKKYDTITFDDALIDRFCHIKSKSSFQIWKDNWATKKDINGNQMISNEILQFLETDKSEQTFDYKTEEDLEDPVECFPSPRAWERVNSIYKLNLGLSLKSQLISGCVGFNISNNFIASINSGKKPISLDEIVSADFSKENDPIVKKIQLYSGYINGEIVLHEGESIVELPLLNMTCEDILREENTDFIQKNYFKVLNFLAIIPSDLAVKVVKRLTTSSTDNKEFWQEKIKETEIDPITNKPLTTKNQKTGKIEPVYVHKKLIEGLQELKKARDSINGFDDGDKNK